MNFFYFSLLSLLFLLTGCGGKNTTAKLEISRSFISTSPLAGGIYVVGESTAGKKFSMAVNGTNQGKVILESGIWTFAAVAWDGGLLNKPMEGTAYCGHLVNFDLSDSNATVNIDINSANCSTEIFTKVTQFNKLFNLLGCDALYNYNSTTDSYTALGATFSPDFCSTSAGMPIEYVTKFKKFRLTALTVVNGLPKPAFMSECKNINDISVDYQLPMQKFPFVISLYKTENDCVNRVASQNYSFMNGLANGGPGFDFAFDLKNQYMVLATSPTKRGRSPFISEIPRFLCQNSPTSFGDCFPEPVLNADVQVPWQGHNHRNQVILKGINPAIKSCPANPLIGSKYFGVTECGIQDRSMRVKLFRNSFMCHNTPFTTGTIKDIHKKGEFIYFLHGSTNARISVYHLNGQLIHEYDIGTSTASRIAANLSGSTIAIADTSGVILYKTNGSLLSSTQVWPVSASQDIELSDDGAHFYVVSSSTYIKSYSSSSGDLVGAFVLTNPITDIKMEGSNLFLLEDSIDGDNVLHSLPTTSGMFSAIGTTYSRPANNVTNFEIHGKRIFYLDKLNKHYYIQEGSNQISSPYDISQHSTGPQFISFADGKVIVADSLNLYTFNPGETIPLNINNGNCSETLTITHGGASSSLILKSSINADLSILFGEAFNFIGRRILTDSVKPFYYFESLSHSDHNSAGGSLARVQQMLGPQALGAFLSEFPRCIDVKNAVIAGGTITKNSVYSDETTGESMGFSFSIANNDVDGGAQIDNFICAVNESTPCPTPVSNRYDLILTFNRMSIGDTEKMRIKLKCGAQTGSFESFELEGTRMRRELYLYTTQDDNNSRLERYSFEKDSNLRGKVSKIYKPGSGNDILVRSIQSEFNGTERRSTVTQFEKNSTQILTSSYETNTTVAIVTYAPKAAYAVGDTNYADVQQNLSFELNPILASGNLCMSSSNTSVSTASITGCLFQSFSTSPLSRDASLTLSPQSLDIEDPSNPLRTTGGVFEIP